MTVLPRVLVVDDLIGRSSDAIDRVRRRLYCDALGLVDGEQLPKHGPVAVAQFCSGQVTRDGRWANSLDVVERAVAAGWPAPDGQWWALALVDLRFGDEEDFGLRVIQCLRRVAPSLPIVVVSSRDQLEAIPGAPAGTLRAAVERLGAEDFLAAPGASVQVPGHEGTAPNLSRRLFEIGLCPDPQQDVVGVSLAVCQMLRRIRQLVPVHGVDQILLRGEPGSGKTQLERYVRRVVSARRSVGLDEVPTERLTLSALDPAMQHVRLVGTTGATQVAPAPGVFETAQRGLVFLDEVGELCREAQSSLLELLQPDRDEEGPYRTVVPVGPRRGRAVRSRSFVLAATARDLETLVSAGRFDEALLSRFASREVVVPPLRDRMGDAPILARSFIRQECDDRGRPLPVVEVTDSGWRAIARERSIRELKLFIELVLRRHPLRRVFTEVDFSVERRVDDVPTARPPDPPRDVPTPPVAAVLSLGMVSASDRFGLIPRIDGEIARWKLSVLRAMLEEQMKLRGDERFELAPVVRVLLGRPRLSKTAPSDFVRGLFRDACVESRPDDPILGRVWDLRLPSRDRRGET